MNDKQVKQFQQKLLTWYDKHRRVMPWRALEGHKADPYHVWLSEIMLQQTTIATVKGYFDVFVSTWPTVRDLAAADEDAILAKWSGLGYYSRARNLHKAARVIVKDFNGRIPDNYDDLLSLPGVGDYTASAVTAIAFNKQATVLDGNVERVVSRIFEIQEKLPKGKKHYREKAVLLSVGDHNRYGDMAQATMDLGSTLCAPKNPKCGQCPVADMCGAKASNTQEEYPKKEKKKAIPKKYAHAYVMMNEKGQFFMRKRGDKGMLAGMYEIPTSEWVLKKKDIQDTEFADVDFALLKGQVKHVFSHFEFYINVYMAPVKHDSVCKGVWVDMDNLEAYGVPTVMKKIIYHALKKSA